MRKFIRVTTLFAMMLGIAAPLAAADAPAPVAGPLVTASPKVGEMWAESSFDEARHGLVEEEFFFEGTTVAGVAYKSRMIVRRPARAARFNGTVIVEWLNASSGNDMDVDYNSVLPLIQREGYAYVGVTAQAITVNFLRTRNAARYGSLQMTDDQPQNAAFEVFSQAGQAVKGKFRGVDPLAGLKAKVVIAIGQSQSASRLTTFVSTVHGLKLAPVYDAVLIHAGGGAPTRFPIPILKLNSENEAAGSYRFRAVSDPNYTYWEVPGTSHSPHDSVDEGLRQLNAARSATGGFPRCTFPYEGAGGPVPIDPVLRSGVWHLDRLVRTGKPIPAGALYEMSPPAAAPAAAAPPATAGVGGPAANAAANAGVIQRDRYGNALGGIRMPQQEVPTGRNTPSTACTVVINGTSALLGTYPQFDAFDGGKDPVVDPADKVNATEPASAKDVYKTHQNYVALFRKATDALLKQGLILKFDADAMKKSAASSDVAR